MKLNRMVLCWIMVALAVCACEKPVPPDNSGLDRLVAESSYVFSGVVDKLGAANMASVPADERTAVVTVNQVYTPSDLLGDLTGKQVTVQFNQGAGMAPGEKAVFFVNGWVYGNGIAFLEVGRMAEEQPEQLKPRVDAALSRKADQRSQDRIDRASLVVVAKVATTHAFQLEKRLPIGEHNPHWQQAVLRVSSVLKGEVKGTELRMLFPGSNDEVWIAAPKPTPDEEGIWILQRDQKEKGGSKYQLPGLTALDALDFQPMDQLERVKTFIDQK